jgi:hypothetical protein
VTQGIRVQSADWPRNLALWRLLGVSTWRIGPGHLSCYKMPREISGYGGTGHGLAVRRLAS